MTSMHPSALKQAMAFLGSWLPFRFSQTTFPGLCVAVGYQGKIVFSRAYGLATIERQEPLRTDHLFSVASQSKMVVAIAIMQLVQRGKLGLDDPVFLHVPHLKGHPDKRMQEVTIRQLLVHSSGLTRDLPNSDFWSLSRPFPTKKAFREQLHKTPIVMEPNTHLKYSNIGYALLGEVIAKVSGSSYISYVTKNILNSVGLASTFADYSSKIQNRTVVGYGVPFERQRAALDGRQATHSLASAVGLHSTAEDMCKLASALSMGNNTLINDAAKKELYRTQWSQRDGYDAGVEFGLGFEVIQQDERRLLGHSGHLAGHITATYFDPHRQLVVSVAANSKDSPSPQIAFGIMGILNYFDQFGRRPLPAAMAHFNTRLHCPTAIVQFVATAGAVVGIDPDDWQPLACREELEQIDTHTFRIVTPGSIFNEGELVHYIFDGGKLKAVTYAGSTLVPEEIYRKELRNSVQKSRQQGPSAGQ